MKAPVSAEAIGLHTRNSDALVAEFTSRFGDPTRLKPWCAEITGRDPTYGYARQFLPPRYDYSQANSVGSRGIYAWWTIETGRLYQMSSRQSWTGGMERRWLVVDEDGDTRELTQEEADRWLNDHSASTS